MKDAIPPGVVAGNAQYDHLLHERVITCELVRVIGSACTWSDAAEAALALIHVRQMAKGMKAERDMHAAKEAASIVQARGGIGAANLGQMNKSGWY